MTALVLINKDGKHFNYLCSATPVSYDSKTNTTFLIGAAHCFVNNKDNLNILTKNNLIPAEHLQIHNGINKDGSTGYAVKAVYLMQNYCYGNTFPEGGACSNFTPSDGAKNGQGNDLAIVQISGKYANPDNYPHIVKSIEYPQKYTMAPVLSIGYGINTQIPENDPPCNSSTCARMFYVANYFYWQQDSDGYHYLYHSYYNENKATPYLDGYANLICGGDSGGGDIFWTGEKWILLSEHTYGPSNSCGGFYKYLTNAATNVSAYYDWIKNIINSPDPISLCNNQTYNCVSNE